jgi:hypothetical protein
MSRTAGRDGKGAGTLRPVDTGGGEAIIQPHLVPLAGQRSRKIFDRGIGEKTGRKVGLPAKLLKDGFGRGLLRRERQLEMVYDAVDDDGLGEERDDSRSAPSEPCR